MAASLLTQLGGKATKEIIDVYPKPKKPKELILRHHRICELLGVEVDENCILQTLGDLGFSLKTQRKGVWRVKVPSFRVDIKTEADLIEEVAIFFGYDKIPSSITPLKVLEPAPNRKRERLNKLRHVLFHYGFDEVLNQSFSDPEKAALFPCSGEAIEIRNPVSSRASHLRTTLLGGLLENALWNTNRGLEAVHIFELGNIYFWEDNTPLEQLRLGILATGPVDLVHWQGNNRPADFFHLKGTCEALLSQLRYVPFSFEEIEHPSFEEGSCLAIIYKGEKVGALGSLRRSILDSYSLKGEVVAAELNLMVLFGKQPQPFLYTPVIKYPGISRDLSFTVKKYVSYQDIKKVIERLSSPYLEEFDLTDRYSGPSIPPDKMSLSLHFVYRHPQRTLLAEEVDKFEQEIISQLRSAFNIQLREGGKIDKRTGKN
jgi:phenylalanyl-tRNA synthetase beta chain